ncbi:non-specific serine/threonine protein kinase KNAG_0J01670 [Huiozyma naganishii CBS 8797]|uniref:non-specific serine/threonine protein kinase n=1 Tax=Huiozyma naganishii (strain ATCC MYA-139 / BCRC 22969 / CBS 8797 / KCTC 17520 / NBRC 10181 / NCYC 3082 / Yp74L-3) TaxID=1071383 RepID=J7RQZ1_HUIN7|nr:hypothetical protein KNAG_0J01670 [Kazachstania naganishii CBS 8797]CCK72248.1 hypothetical protein KNAG_0J01670 [Kazachstania naganishii CBS 8797]
MGSNVPCGSATMRTLEANNVKAIIGSSYNKLYSEFCSSDLTVVGNYKILEQIGEGSFGKVYLAMHRPTHRKVVIKSSVKNDPNIVREVFYHRQFEYHYITKLYEIIVTESKVWMALEYCPGRELYDHVLQMKRIPAEECIQLFSQIVGAVYYAHSLNCVHRDLKLENILLDKDGNAKLTDFGFTRECMEKVNLETICGTTVYMAPELTERKPYDGFKIDIWSLGVILYTMLSGSMPFDEDDEAKTKWKIINEEPEYNSKFMTAEGEDLVRKLLQKDSNLRPSVREILQHEFLQPYGTTVLTQTDNLIARQRKGATNFHSKLERRVLKRLNRCGFDTQSIKQSVIKKKCDSLAGLWCLLLEKEKKYQKRKQLRRSKSILSVGKKVISNSISTTSDQLRPQDDGLLRSPWEVTKGYPFGKMINMTTDASLSLVALGSRKSHEETFQQNPPERDSSERNTSKSITAPPRTSSTATLGSKDTAVTTGNGKKVNIFKKVSDFFKIKKHSEFLQHSGRSITSHQSEHSPERSEISEPPNKVNNEQKRLNKRKGNDHTAGFTGNHDNLRPLVAHSTPVKAAVNKQNRSQREKGKREVEQPQIKRFKSTVSSDTSDKISPSINDYSQSGESPQPSNEGRKTSLLQLNSRPLSSISQISNETYTSDYSTDGATSFFQRSKSELTRPSVSHTTSTGGASQHSSMTVGSDKLHPVVSKSKTRFIRRNMSMRSENSSASDRSSRADSFYDITTATPQVIGNLRSNSNGSNKNMGTNRSAPIMNDSVLPRIGGSQRTWSAKNGYSVIRRNNIGRRGRARKSPFLKSAKDQLNSVIKEEESSSCTDVTDGEIDRDLGTNKLTTSKFIRPKFRKHISDTALNNNTIIMEGSEEDSVDKGGVSEEIEDEEPIFPEHENSNGLSYSDSETYAKISSMSRKANNPDTTLLRIRTVSEGVPWPAFNDDPKSLGSDKQGHDPIKIAVDDVADDDGDADNDNEDEIEDGDEGNDESVLSADLEDNFSEGE